MNLVDAFDQLDARASAQVALRWAARATDRDGEQVLAVAARVAADGGADRDQLQLLGALLEPHRQGAVPVWYAAARHIHRRHQSTPGATYPVSLAAAARRDGTPTPTQWADIAEAAGATSSDAAQIAAAFAADGWDGQLADLIDTAELLARQPPAPEPHRRQPGAAANVRGDGPGTVADT